jgi:hypothetical protein
LRTAAEFVIELHHCHEINWNGDVCAAMGKRRDLLSRFGLGGRSDPAVPSASPVPRHQPIFATIQCLSEIKDRLQNSEGTAEDQRRIFTDYLIMEVRELNAFLDFTEDLLKNLEREDVMEEGIRDQLRHMDRDLARTNAREIDWNLQKKDKLKTLAEIVSFFLTCSVFHSALYQARFAGQLGKGKLNPAGGLVQRLAEARTKLWDQLDKRGIEL